MGKEIQLRVHQVQKVKFYMDDRSENQRELFLRICVQLADELIEIFQK